MYLGNMIECQFGYRISLMVSSRLVWVKYRFCKKLLRYIQIRPNTNEPLTTFFFTLGNVFTLDLLATVIAFVKMDCTEKKLGRNLISGLDMIKRNIKSRNFNFRELD